MDIITDGPPGNNPGPEAPRPRATASAAWLGRVAGGAAADAEEVAGWLRLLTGGGAVELRALGVPDGRFRRTCSGFFDEDRLDDMAREALALSGRAQGVYFTLNPLHPDLLARRCNRVDVADPGDAATDQDVVARRWLLVDADPRRRPGISATDGEKAAAREVVGAVREHLGALGWPGPVLADSGNGYHLLYRVELEPGEGDLVRGVLAALASRFDTDAVEVDRKVFNASRIVKLYGTLARKGDHTPRRPHRRAAVLEVPTDLRPVPRNLLEALAGGTIGGAVIQQVDGRACPGDGAYDFGREEARGRARAYLEKERPWLH